MEGNTEMLMRTIYMRLFKAGASAAKSSTLFPSCALTVCLLLGAEQVVNSVSEPFLFQNKLINEIKKNTDVWRNQGS